MKIRDNSAFQIVSIAFCNFWNLRFAIADDSDIFGYNVKPNDAGAHQLNEYGQSNQSEPYVPGTTYNTPLTYDNDHRLQYQTPRLVVSPNPSLVMWSMQQH
jgi:hypothetical protein